MNKEQFRIYMWCISKLKKYSVFVILFIILVFIQELFLVEVTRIIQQFIDNVGQGDKELLVNLVVRLSGVALITIIVRPLYMYCKMIFVEKSVCDIQYDILYKARELGIEYFEKTSRGQILAETYENVLAIYFLYENYFSTMIILSFGVILPFIMIVMGGYIWITIYVFLCYILILVSTLFIDKKINKVGEKILLKNNKFYAIIYDIFDSINEIKSYSAEHWMIKKQEENLGELHDAQLEILKLENVVAYVSAFLQVIMMLIFFFMSIYLHKEHQISVGNIVAYYFYTVASITAMIKLANLIVEQKKLIMQAKKPYEFFKKNPEDTSPHIHVDTPIEGSIKFDNVQYSCDGQDILSGVSFNINKGEKVAIIGKSGCGKSTILKLIMGYKKPNEGEVMLGGHPVSSYSLKNLRKYISIVFQEPFIFSESIKENLLFANYNAELGDVEKACKNVNLEEFVLGSPNGYNTLITGDGNNISGGQRQRLSLARIFMRKPSVVLLDEVTSELDLVSQNIVVENVLNHFKEETVVMVSHRIEVIKQFSRIIVIEDGRVVEEGTYEFLSTSGVKFNELLRNGGVDYE